MKIVDHNSFFLRRAPLSSFVFETFSCRHGINFFFAIDMQRNTKDSFKQHKIKKVGIVTYREALERKKLRFGTYHKDLNELY